MKRVPFLYITVALTGWCLTLPAQNLTELQDSIPASEAAYKPFVPRSYAYCSDTAPFPREAAWLKGTTVIYHEATYLRDLEDQGALRHHSTTLQAARVALEAECRTLFPETYATSDGDSFDI